MNSIDLAGHVAVITGGGSGIGLASARRFLQSGARVELWGRDANKLDAAVDELRALGPVTRRAVDVSDADAVQHAAQQAQAALGHVDILFNNAGVALEVCPMIEMSLDAWHRNIAINLNGVFYCCRALAPAMIRRGWGRIINVSSMAGKDGNPFQAAYSAAKGGVIAFTKSLGKELATSGVTVNAIAPTLFETPLAMTTMADAPEAMKAVVDKIPMRRIGRADEAAAMAAWLASDDCSFTTGFTFDLSGGRATY
ncbi:MAG TPA: SDR family NAD(P)-dependent oxidoreductase [Albitalea sp.]|nr:SDR family NAD(P)-dependent oxidoreductase [Albitalea sp.]